jgi:ATP-dependent protease Clp ATPase subunit
MAIEGVVRCTFCGVERDHTWKVVVGFGTVICDGCVRLCHEAVATAPESPLVIPIRPTKVGPTLLAKGILPAPRPFDVACPFCNGEPADGRPLFLADTASICSECIALCEEIYEQERRAGGG